MSIKDVFTVWGQDTRQRTQKALERADFEMRQLNLTEQARIDRLMKMLEMKNKTLVRLRSERQKMKLAYDKMYAGRGKTASQEYYKAANAFKGMAEIIQQAEIKDVQGYLDFSKEYKEKFERTANHQSVFNEYSALFDKHAHHLSGKDAAGLESWLVSQGDALRKLNDAIDKTPTGGNAPVNQELVNSIAQNLWEKMPTSEQRVGLDIIQDILVRKTGVSKLIDETTKNQLQTTGKSAEWKADKGRHIEVEGNILQAYADTYENFETIRDKAPEEVKPVFDDAQKGLIPDLEKGIKKTEEQLEAAKITAYDYGAVQKRAGEILLGQESAQKMKDIPDEEVEYLQSLPEAFKYEKMDSLDKQGPMGALVQAMMGEKQKLSWSQILARIKDEARGDEKKYRRGREMAASRILKAGKVAQGIQDTKNKGIRDAFLEMDKTSDNRSLWNIIDKKQPIPPSRSVGQVQRQQIKGKESKHAPAPGTVLKQDPQYGYGYKVKGYDASGQPEFVYMRRGKEGGGLNPGQLKEAMELWNAQSNLMRRDYLKRNPR